MYCVFNKTSKKFVRGDRVGLLQYDPSTHVQVELPVFPVDDERLNDTEDGIRPVTQTELDADTAAEETKKVNAFSDVKRAAKAQVWVNFDFIKDLTLYANKTDYWEAIVTAYRDQPWKT